MGRAGSIKGLGKRKVRRGRKYVGEVISMSYHRNGIAGEGFWAIIFEGHGEAEDGIRGQRFIAAYFGNDENRVRTAILRIDDIAVDGDTTHAWRGDVFHDELAKLVENYDHDARKPSPDRRGAVEHSKSQVSDDLADT